MFKSGRSVFLLLVPLFFVPTVGACAGRDRDASTHPSSTKAQVGSGNFDLDANRLVELAPDDPLRAALQAEMAEQLATTVKARLSDESISLAAQALRSVGFLYLPAELETAPHAPALANAAQSLYDAAAKRGDEESAFVALVVLRHLGDPKQREYAKKAWPELRSWVKTAADQYEGSNPAAPERMLLQMTLAFVPSPWVADLLVQSYDRELAQLQRGDLAVGALERDESAARLLYWSMRLHLRMGRIDGAIARLDAEKKRAPGLFAQFRPFYELFVRTQDPSTRRSSMLELIEKLDPNALEAPAWVLHDAWSTVEQLARQLVQTHPEDPAAHLGLARALNALSLYHASIPHYERALPDLGTFAVWSDLAYAHAESLNIEVDVDLARARAHLKKIEAFHSEAAKLFPDQKLVPGINDARLRVAQGLFDAGDIDATKALCHAIVQEHPTPEAIELLATIALREGRIEQANARLEELLGAKFESDIERLRWEIAAHLLWIELRSLSRDKNGVKKHAQSAAERLDALLDIPGIPPSARAELFMQRFEVRLTLGEFDKARSDLQRALHSDPQQQSFYVRGLSQYLIHNRTQDAADLFHRAQQVTLDPINRTYVALWTQELALRHNDRELATQTQKVLDHPVGNRWTRALAAFAARHSDAGQLLAAATTPSEKAEAHFYIALRKLRDDQKSDGQASLRKVLDSHMMGLVEYKIAQQMLADTPAK